MVGVVGCACGRQGGTPKHRPAATHAMASLQVPLPDDQSRLLPPPSPDACND